MTGPTQDLAQAGRFGRFGWLDGARGAALIAMAVYHFIWDLELFGYLAAGTAGTGSIKLFARAIASSFLVLAGFSLVLATAGGIRWRPYLTRLAKVAGAAALISLATFLAMPQGAIFFGILHHIALAGVIGLLFIRLPWFVALACAPLAFALPHIWPWPTEHAALQFIGLYAVPPVSNDFVPVFPWLSAGLVGIAAAQLALAQDWLTGSQRGGPDAGLPRALQWLGRRSLIVYLVHQPVLIGLVWLATQIVPPMAQNGGPEAFLQSCQRQCAQDFETAACARYCDCFLDRLNNLSNVKNYSTMDDTQRGEIITVCSAEMNRP
ncbi:MAG: DUF1624 domain-containing protein [Phyllobacteriaceae bacterium]|nr:DUF1624 domain-containing protein [Phyllobacteriaceae bacterium]